LRLGCIYVELRLQNRPAAYIAKNLAPGKAAMSEGQILTASRPTRNQRQITHGATLEGLVAAALTREEIDARIERIGIIPTLRLDSATDILFVADALREAGVPVVEISLEAPGAVDAIAHVTRNAPEIIVGAGNLFSTDAARRCIDAGAKFLTSDIFVPEVVELAAGEKITVIPGALTPAEIMTAWSAGADFVKITPCDALGGHKYLRTLKAALPSVRLVAAGGVNQLTALSFIKAEAAALSVGDELIPREAIWLRQTSRIQEMARRFRNAVVAGRISEVAAPQN
jgi:2-dehydro-3-deoxyphosphogluconate aldolase / (4S)-4-hydroxy-2-oxoglutarate aldolase